MKNNKQPEIRFHGFTQDWEQRKLGEIMQVTSVKRIHQSDWTDIGVRFLRARDVVSAFKGEEPADYLYISKDKYNEYSKISGKVQQGDMLVTGVGSIGVPYLIKDDSPVYFKDGNIIWFKNDHKINGNFFYYSFINNKIQQYIRNVAGIGTVGTYTIDSGKKTPIQLPTIEEQQIIGSFFKQLDESIALHQQELTTLKETKQGFLQKMFPKEGEKVPEVRFPGFTNDWEQCKLGDVGTVVMNKRIFKEQTSERGEVPFYKIGTFGGTPDAFIPRSLFEEYKLKYPYPEIGDILISASGSIGRTVEYTGKDEYFQDSNIVWLKHDEQLNNSFLKQFYVIVKWHGLEGSTIKRLYNKNILNTAISLPSINEQIKIGTFLKKFDDTIALHQRELDLLKETKKAFLQKMFV